MSDRSQLEMYQSFMAGYVKRINQGTFNVTINGVRIGTAKYTRLAQVNLKTRIITFSKFAIENVPERGRRYLVIHELAHIKEANHNRHFWELVETHEPHYKKIGRELDLAFKRNVKEDQQSLLHAKRPNPLSGRLEEPKLLLGPQLLNLPMDALPSAHLLAENDLMDDDFECTEDNFGMWDDDNLGTITGGSLVMPVAV